MNKIYMMVGIQGSGKSTFSNLLSKKLNIDVISSDSIRNEIKDINENDVFPLVYKRIAEHIALNNDVIYDATSITKESRRDFFEEMDKNKVGKYEVICVYFVPDVKLSKERVSKRNKIEGERFLPLEVIDDYANRIIEPSFDEGFSNIIFINSNENFDEVYKKMV